MQQANKKIAIHIADDHQIIIDGLMAILEFESDIDVVGASLNGQEVLDWFLHNSADILLLDINMPDISGLEVMHALKNYKTIPRVIILSSYDNYKLIKDVLKLGAQGFVPKKSAGEHIVHAIHAVSKGKQYFTDEVKEKMMNALMNKEATEEENLEGELINSLTKRELEILKLIAQQQTTKDICDKLFISPSTVETHRKNLLKKIKAKNSVGLALFALKNNIL
jgi:DNA-binding NarL/FixJ family response regulator